MAKYDVRVRYAFEGTYTVVAEDHDEARQMVSEDCGLVLGGNIHTTLDDEDVDWNFGVHPDTQILSVAQRNGKGTSASIDFSGRIEELRADIIEAIRQLLQAHCMTEIRFPEDDGYDPVWVIWFNKNGDPYECMVTEEGNFFNEKFPSFIIVIYAALGSASAAASDEAPPSSPLPSST